MNITFQQQQMIRSESSGIVNIHGHFCNRTTIYDIFYLTKQCLRYRINKTNSRIKHPSKYLAYSTNHSFINPSHVRRKRRRKLPSNAFYQTKGIHVTLWKTPQCQLQLSTWPRKICAIITTCRTRTTLMGNKTSQSIDQAISIKCVDLLEMNGSRCETHEHTTIPFDLSSTILNQVRAKTIQTNIEKRRVMRVETRTWEISHLLTTWDSEPFSASNTFSGNHLHYFPQTNNPIVLAYKANNPFLSKMATAMNVCDYERSDWMNMENNDRMSTVIIRKRSMWQLTIDNQ